MNELFLLIEVMNNVYGFHLLNWRKRFFKKKIGYSQFYNFKLTACLKKKRRKSQNVKRNPRIFFVLMENIHIELIKQENFPEELV